MPRGSPFGPDLRALAICLRFPQAIAFERLAVLLSDLLGLEISEGALINIPDAAQAPFEAQKSRTSWRVVSGPMPVAEATRSGE